MNIDQFVGIYLRIQTIPVTLPSMGKAIKQTAYLT